MAATHRFTQAEEEYLHTFWLMTLTPSNAPSAPHRLFSAAAQSGPPPPMPSTQPAPSAPFPVPPAPVTPQVAPPVVPPQHFSYTPGGWGLVPNYYPAPVQPYPIGYPPGPWPPYQQYYAGPQGHGKEDSEMAKPNKFTGWDPSKLCPFIVCLIMAFDSRPCKFATDRQ